MLWLLKMFVRAVSRAGQRGSPRLVNGDSGSAPHKSGMVMPLSGSLWFVIVQLRMSRTGDISITGDRTTRDHLYAHPLFRVFSRVRLSKPAQLTVVTP